MDYKHTQVGYLIISITIILIILFTLILIKTNLHLFILTTTIIILIILSSFSTLTVTIDEENLKIKFGYGIFFKNFPLKEIVSATTVKNKWYYGWGIRIWLWPKIIIFNISGFDAVEIKTVDKKTYRIGTNEPQKLETTIRRNMGQISEE